MQKYLEYHDDKSSKFWEITLDGASFTVRYGKTGTAGQKLAKQFASADEAEKEAEKLMREKSAKGYMEKAAAGEEVLATKSDSLREKAPSDTAGESDSTYAHAKPGDTEHTEKWKHRFEEMVAGLRADPSIRVEKVNFGEPGTAANLERARNLAKGCFPEGLLAFCREMDGFDLEWSTKVEGKEVTGSIHLQPLCDIFFDGGYYEEPYEHLRAFDRFQPEACACFYPAPAHDSEVYFHYWGEELLPLNMGFNDYLDLLIKTRGLFYWHDALTKRHISNKQLELLPLVFKDCPPTELEPVKRDGYGKWEKVGRKKIQDAVDKAAETWNSMPRKIGEEERAALPIDLYHPELISGPRLASSKLTDCVLSPDERILAAASSRFVRHQGEGYDVGQIFLWDLKAGKLLDSYELGERNDPGGLAWSNDNRRLAFSYMGVYDRRFSCITLADRKIVTCTSGFRDGIRITRSSADNRYWLINCGKDILVLDQETLETAYSIKANGWVADLRVSPDSKIVGAVYEAKQKTWLAVWDLANGSLIKEIVLKGLQAPGSLAFINHHAFAVGDESGQIGYGSLDKPDLEIQPTGFTGKVENLFVDASGWKAFIKTSDWREAILAGPAGNIKFDKASSIYPAAYSSSGKYFTFKRDRCAELWDLGQGVDILNPEGRRLQRFIVDLHFSADSRKLYSFGGSVAIIDLDSGEQDLYLYPEGEENATISSRGCLSPDQRYISTYLKSDEIVIHDLKANRQVGIIKHKDPDQEPHALFFSPDGRRFAVSNKDSGYRILTQGKSNGVSLYRISEEEIIPDQDYPGGFIDPLWHIHQGVREKIDTSYEYECFSGDGKTFAVAYDSGRIVVYALPEFAEIASVQTDRYSTKMALSFDGKCLAHTTEREGVHVISLPGGAILAQQRHDDSVEALAFSPDGRLLASADYAGKILLKKL